VILIYMDTKCNHIISCSLKFKTMEMFIRLRQYFTTFKFYFLSDTATVFKRKETSQSLLLACCTNVRAHVHYPTG